MPDVCKLLSQQYYPKTDYKLYDGDFSANNPHAAGGRSYTAKRRPI